MEALRLVTRPTWHTEAADWAEVEPALVPVKSKPVPFVRPKEPEVVIPIDTAGLSHNYIPVPRMPQIKIGTNLSVSATVTIELLDLRGRPVKTILSRSFPAGTTFYTWNVRAADMRSGLYFVKITSTNWQSPQVLKLMIVR